MMEEMRLNKSTGRIALLICTLDLAIKVLFMDRSSVLIPGVVAFDPVMNPGVAFGLFAGTPAVSGALALALIFLLSVYVRHHVFSPLSALGSGLLLGGAVGNLLDRLLHGAVSDYLRLLFFRFPVFNLADICVTMGVSLLILSLLTTPKEAY